MNNKDIEKQRLLNNSALTEGDKNGERVNTPLLENSDSQLINIGKLKNAKGSNRAAGGVVPQMDRPGVTTNETRDILNTDENEDFDMRFAKDTSKSTIGVSVTKKAVKSLVKVGVSNNI